MLLSTDLMLTVQLTVNIRIACYRPSVNEEVKLFWIKKWYSLNLTRLQSIILLPDLKPV